MLEALDHRAVRLGPGPFEQARRRNREWLRNLEPNRLLHRFDANAGLPARGPIYGGWESATLSGHSLGHALSAWAREADDDTTCADHLRFAIERLDALQARRGDGFIGGMPDADRVFGELRQGVVRSSGFDLNDCWVPWYNIHKTLAGLVDCARFTGNDTALAVANRLGEWVEETTRGLDRDAWQRMLACEHGGMMEALADLAVLTGRDDFLDLAKRFHHQAVLDPLERGEDPLPGLHGNTQIPKVLGCARLFELSGESRYRAISEQFLQLVLEHHTYATGGHGSDEHFGKPGVLGERLSNTNCETCNTHNLLRLARAAFAWQPRAHLLDFIEQALWNHILASQRPTDGMLAYFTPLQSGRFRTWSTADDSFWCCVGTGWENHARYAEYVAWRGAGALWLTGTIPGTIHIDETTVAVEPVIETDRVVVELMHGGSDNAISELRLRRPGWAKSCSGVAVPESLATHHGAPGQNSQWDDQNGFLELRTRGPSRVVFEHAPRFVPLPDMPHRVAICDGPFLLAVDQGPAPAEIVEGTEELPDADIAPAPVIVDDQPDAATWARRFGMRPFHSSWDRRSAVYIDSFTVAEWQACEASYRAKERQDHDARKRWIDAFWPFQMQPERDHGYESANAHGGERSAWKYREAAAGGWFSFTLRCNPEAATELVATWGPPLAGPSVARILVDDVAVGEIQLPPDRHRHIEQVLPVPDSLTRGKSKIRVTLTAPTDRPSPPLFLIRSRKSEPSDSSNAPETDDRGFHEHG